MKQNRLRYETAALVAAVFVMILVLNQMTPYVADDYSYLIHFGTKEPIRSLKDVAESMYVHSLHMNGRVVSHSLAQIFSMAPKFLFNLCNAAIFAGLVYWMFRMACFGQKPKALLFAMIFMGLFCAMPVFGQVCLWYVGAFNYLWALLGGLIFVTPFLLRFLGKADPLRGWRFGVYCAGCLLFGMYSEITSFVMIFLAFALMVVPGVFWKKPLKTKLWFGWLLACAGYLILLAIPAERNAKQADGLNFAVLLTNFDRATEMLMQYCVPLLTLWVILFGLGLVQKIGRERLVWSALMLFGALGGNYMTMAASYYPERCLATTVMLLILSIATLAAPYANKSAMLAAGAILSLCFAVQAYTGVSDIARCHRDFLAREAVIQQAAEAGETIVTAEIVIPQTPYSAFWDLRDMSTDDPTTWPNFAMGKYYGIQILGKLPQA